MVHPGRATPFCCGAAPVQREMDRPQECPGPRGWVAGWGPGRRRPAALRFCGPGPARPGQSQGAARIRRRVGPVSHARHPCGSSVSWQPVRETPLRVPGNARPRRVGLPAVLHLPGGGGQGPPGDGAGAFARHLAAGPRLDVIGYSGSWGVERGDATAAVILGHGNGQPVLEGGSAVCLRTLRRCAWKPEGWNGWKWRVAATAKGPRLS